jgi:hypothetical protein
MKNNYIKKYKTDKSYSNKNPDTNKNKKQKMKPETDKNNSNKNTVQIRPPTRKCPQKHPQNQPK